MISYTFHAHSPKYIQRAFVIVFLMVGCIKDPEPTILQSMRPELLPKGTIYGQTMDFRGNPVPGVQVITNQGYSGVTNSDGSFCLDELPEGDYSLSFIRYGFLDTTIFIESLGINENRSLKENLFLRNGLSNISGQVLSYNGIPVPNAAVVFSDHPFSTKTDRNGFFSFSGVSPEVRRIMAAHDSVGWGQALLQLHPGEDVKVTIRLYQGRTGSIMGTVFKEDNTPDSGAIVRAFGGAYIDTAIDGTYLLDNIPCSVPVTISAGPTRMVSGVLISETDPVAEVNLKHLQYLQSGNLAVFERQVFTLESDGATIFADVRIKDDNHCGYDSVAAFVWKYSYNDNTFDTCTSDPFLTIMPIPEQIYQYGVITFSGDTICCVPITLIEKKSTSQIIFSDGSFYPANITITGSDSVTLSWKAFDSDGRLLEYSVFFGGSNTNPPSFYQSGIIDTFLTVRPHEGWLENSYIWQIEAHSSQSTVKSKVNLFIKK